MRKAFNNTIDIDLYTELKILALKLGCNANDLLEEGMRMVLEKYGKLDQDKQSEKNK